MPYQQIGPLQWNRPPEKSIIIHADGDWFDAVLADKFDFFSKLALVAQTNDFAACVVRASDKFEVSTDRPDQIHLHIGARPNHAENMWHVHPSYLYGFWYLDPRGVHHNSSVFAKPFNPAEIDADAARYFFDGVAGYNLRHNRSKFTQAARKPRGAALADSVFYMQEIETYKQPVHYLTSETIIRTLADQALGLVFVKVHPAQSEAMRHRISALVDTLANAEIKSDSIHDLTANSRIVVTQNSAAGFEALMQKKPVITCAKSDFHHATLVAKTTADLAAAVANASNSLADFPYQKYLFWFLNQNMLESAKPEFSERAWRRLTAGR